MEEYKVKQIWPAHADHISYYKQKFIDDLFKSSRVVCQRKYDGERMLMHFNKNEVYCTSRRFSKKTGRYMENQDKLDDLKDLSTTLNGEKMSFGYTVIDCECYSNTWSDVVGVLHSLPERAHELQKTTKIKFAVFDCLFFNGEDLREKPYIERLNYVKLILLILNFYKNDMRFHQAEQTEINNIDEAYQIAQEYWDKGMEGVVIKPLNFKYYDKGAMLKIKRFETVDCVVYGYQVGRGKYEGTIGALLIGYYDTDSKKIIHCSKVNCGTDEDRDWWRDYFKANASYFDTDSPFGIIPQEKFKVIEVKCQEITEKSLRHPVYIRRRDDKSIEMCTKETIFKE